MKGFVLGFLAAAVVLTGGYLIYTRWGGSFPNQGAEQPVKYHCPMHPTYISDKPGDCPICGMKLVPMETQAPSPAADSHADHPSTAPSTAQDENSAPGYATVTIPRERIQLMGIVLAEARQMPLEQSIRTFGRVTFDETRVHHVHTKFEGFIEHLYVDYVGQSVKRGQPLFSVYSPELYATQNEYLLALRAREQMPQLSSPEGGARVDLVAAARQRLALWDIGAEQIRELERTRKPIRALVIHSPVSGYVTAKTALQGLRVMPGETLYDIVDLSTVWVQADIYQVNLPFVEVGQLASFAMPYQPGKAWRGRVVFVNPMVEPETRTVKARIELANPNLELKPEMYGDVVIGGARGSGVAIPDSAVIATGERNIVFVAKGEGVFEPREVVLGVKVRDLREVRQGVTAGERVVTAANFLLDSESKLKASISGAGAHQH
jgi:Cu(I)/Ag(I) efflux system membrane fusion protein